ncbi:hypothetical protein HON86_01895 [Candidatus Woesearchaeota archaeon]|jgi:dTDP-glucose pyrophosphorylase|nr:hypothetical protein [Candidatus Woesearchaeota archaeon]MBT6735114.1 hypothetical protein [Candidatus Woesearchaeota archaeon]MBT7848932.1 hypothetical protein [Candidatus Woesearchaeota archaeon]
MNGIKLNLILTMAGTYARFTKEGYKIPKYLLPWGSTTIITELLNEFTKTNIIDNIFLIANREDMDYAPHLQKTLKHFNIPKENLVYIDTTAGQAETAAIAIKKFKTKLKDDPFLIHNIDTLLYNRDFNQIKKSLEKNDGYIDIFESSNPAYCYLLSNDANEVYEIAEKILISDMASSGLYGFTNSKIFLDNFDNEIFISEIYKKIIKSGKILSGILYDESSTVVLGTPVEYVNKTNLLIK